MSEQTPFQFSDMPRPLIHPIFQGKLSFLSSLIPAVPAAPQPAEEVKHPLPAMKSVAEVTHWVEMPIKALRAHCLEEIRTAQVSPQDFVCPICRCEYYERMLQMSDSEAEDLDSKMKAGQIVVGVARLSKCANHFFHKECVEHMAETCGAMNAERFVKCPVCGTIYGKMIGDMPKGKMYVKRYQKEYMYCEGYEDAGTIEITYHVLDGERGGVYFTGMIPCKFRIVGTLREAFLPDTPEGNELLRLLQVAFDRKLTFTVGTSVTSGEKNIVVWNGIHHKTALCGGPACYGYPDPTYFARVKQELAAKGIFPEDLA